MNWVGGSRKRIMATKERRKQKDFFEKEKLKSKMKLLKVSPLKSSAVSLDLLNLYVVNQISTKKEYTDNIRKPVHVDINRGIKIPLRRHNVELPNSPEQKLPKQFSDDIQDRVQQEVLENRRKYLSEKENFQSQYLQSSQPANIKCEISSLSKAAYRQRDFSVPDEDASVGQYFQQLNSSEYSETFGKVTAATDFGNGHREEPLFGNVENTLKATQSESPQPIEALFEEENQQYPTISTSQSYHPFAKKNIIHQLFTDLSDNNQISNLHSPYHSKEIHQMTSSAQTCSAERDLKGIFTAPEHIFFPKSRSLNTVNEEPIKSHLKDYYSQERIPIIYSDKQQNTTVFENRGGFKNQKKDINTADTVQNYLKKGRKSGLAKPNLDHLQIFGLEETEKKVYNYYDQHSNQERQKDDESQLSSQSPSYSPKQTDRYVRTSSDESEKEEQDGKPSCHFEDSFARYYGNPLPVSGSQRSQCSCHSTGMCSIFLNNGSRETAEIFPQTKPATDLRKDKLQRATANLSDPALKNKYANFKARYNAWSQTETCTERMEKSDAAVQCDIMEACSCKNELSSVHSAEIVTSASKIETTGGQNIPADRAALQPSSSSNSVLTKGLSLEAEYLTVHGKINLGIIDYINVINKGEMCD
ncbi:regulator of DNA class I crossover intermediates 1 [Elgaria multicarinata webbii]|uniref:regulator of DNA class I crossover intermediates 1 n=1 Tax=Elgaria multicarinata webbii TaxID=159646 RepID=UPI002FCD422D